MADTTKYTVTFPNGTTIKRTSLRTYSHAWLVIYMRNAVGIERARNSGWNIDGAEVLQRHGFAGSGFLAEKALKEHLPDRAFYDIVYSGVALAR